MTKYWKRSFAVAWKPHSYGFSAMVVSMSKKINPFRCPQFHARDNTNYGTVGGFVDKVCHRTF